MKHDHLSTLQMLGGLITVKESQIRLEAPDFRYGQAIPEGNPVRGPALELP